jgi:UDP-N-acetylglucosamine:LPS N-acetylglucosamine transferase
MHKTEWITRHALDTRFLVDKRNMTRPTILILTSQTGGGHISLAEALRDQLTSDYAIEMNDPQPHFFHLHYRLVSRYALWLWAAEFRQTNTARQALLAHRLFTPLVARNLTALILRLIITTYPFLSYEVTHVLKQMGRSIPFIMLFADPNSVHASWLTERAATATFAPTRETYQQAREHGFAPERVHLSGWPVRAQFLRAQPQEREPFLTNLNLDPQRFTIFLQGGGEGAAQFARTIERTLAISEKVQLILACGTNRTLYERFRTTPRIFALPFTREIASYMAVADVIMGKAGPNMLFEGIALSKPFIVTTYIPGQEQGNLAFIQRHRLGWIALTPTEQRNLLLHLMAHKEEVRQMQQSVERYWNWNKEANCDIVPLIKSLVEKETTLEQR